MDLILKAKHWQVFLILMSGLLLNNFKIEGHQLVTMILGVSGLLIMLFWPLLIGHGLYGLLPGGIKLNYNLFLINGLIALSVIPVIIIISGGKGMTFEGLAALPILYVFYAYLHLISFPAKVLKSIELEKEAAFTEYIGYFILILFFPVGIWILQPKMNKIMKAHEQVTA